MSAEKPVYLILGAAGSGRREVVADLIEGGFSDGQGAAVLLSESEAPDAADERLPRIGRWRWTEERTIEGALPAAEAVFFFCDGRGNPVDQVEAFKAWLAGQGAQLARIVCVVNCALAGKHAPLLAWYDACVHFSDVVLLNRREGVDNKWLGAFQARFKDQRYPCLIEPVKAGRVRNPALVLDTVALRMSQVFEEEQDWVAADGSDEEDESAGDEEVEMVPVEDPYFARNPGGRRLKEIPDIAKFL